VQDFDPDVQKAVHRVQPFEQVAALMADARRTGFDSINMDLIYGLPRQTTETFTRTLASVVEMRPNRIAVYSYAHVPWLRPNQKTINPAELPDANLKFELFGAAIEAFLAAGYEPIGMDHFALPDDELAIAARERRLHRNFMGYTTRPAADMVGVGVSSIGDVCGAFAQNEKKLPRYYAALDAGRFPIERGYLLSNDDLVRRHVITQLMCNFFVDTSAVEARFGIEFPQYFAAELDTLSAAGGPMVDGFLDLADGDLAVTARGRLFVRNICMTFDRYLPAHAGRPVFSRTI